MPKITRTLHRVDLKWYTSQVSFPRHGVNSRIQFIFNIQISKGFKLAWLSDREQVLHQVETQI